MHKLPFSSREGGSKRPALHATPAAARHTRSRIVEDSSGLLAAGFAARSDLHKGIQTNATRRAQLGERLLVSCLLKPPKSAGATYSTAAVLLRVLLWASPEAGKLVAIDNRLRSANMLEQAMMKTHLLLGQRVPNLTLSARGTGLRR